MTIRTGKGCQLTKLQDGFLRDIGSSGDLNLLGNAILKLLFSLVACHGFPFPWLVCQADQ